MLCVPKQLRHFQSSKTCCGTSGALLTKRWSVWTWRLLQPQRRQTNPKRLGMQVQIRTNSLEFEFAPNSHEFVAPSELEFAPSNSNSLQISLNPPDRVNP